jgi:hypothetical protein
MFKSQFEQDLNLFNLAVGLLDNTCLIDGEKWIRWDSRGLYENVQYLDIFPKGTNIIVEYYPESHDPLGFVDFIKKLNNMRQGDQKFWISFDAGHFERARYLYPECSKISSEEWLFKFLNHIGIASLIKMIEISNISAGGHNAHVSVFDGVVDFANIFAIVGQAVKKKKIDKPFFLVLEGTPLSYKEIKEFAEIKFHSYFEAMEDEDRFSKLKNKYL